MKDVFQPAEIMNIPQEGRGEAGVLSFFRKALHISPTKPASTFVHDMKQDVTSRDMHEKLKESAKDVELSTNTQRFWSRYVYGIGASMLGASLFAVLLISNNILFAAICAAAATGMMVFSHAIDQNAMTQSTDNRIDIGDLRERRSAKYIAQELEKVLKVDKQSHSEAETQVTCVTADCKLKESPGHTAARLH